MAAESEPAADDVPRIAHRFRLQYEETQSSWVLLYPEGMVKLSGSAGEIMKRIDGHKTLDNLIDDLETAFPGAKLRQDVLEFIKVAHGRGWITV